MANTFKGMSDARKSDDRKSDDRKSNDHDLRDQSDAAQVADPLDRPDRPDRSDAIQSDQSNQSDTSQEALANTPALPESRFRLTPRTLSDDEKALHDAIKVKAAELEALFGKVEAGRYLALGVTHLEMAVMWAVKELTK